MDTTKKTMISILTLGVLAVSCEKETAVPSTVQSNVNISAHLSPVTDADGVAIPEECPAKWDEGTTFNLWNISETVSDNNVPFSLSKEAEEILFTGTLSSAGTGEKHSLYAVYSKTGIQGTSPTYISVKVPSSQRQDGAVCGIMDYALWTATAETTDLFRETIAMQFSPYNAVIKLNINADGTDIAGKKLGSVMVESETPIVGNAVFNLTENRTDIPAEGKTVNITTASEPELSGQTAVYAVTYPAEFDGTSLVIRLVCTDRSVASLTIPAPEKLCAGKMTECHIRLAELIQEGKADVSEYREDLSEVETSNCYIVSKAGKYQFKATKGCGSKVPEGIVKADWLWMDGSDLISNVQYRNGMILLEAGEKKGNAVIAGYNESEDIVWSWHIWLTDNPGATTHYGMTTEYQLLDRNLGAVSTSVDDRLSYGLYYQWGRKDPFIGANTYGTKVKREERPGFTTATAEYSANGEGLTFRLVKNTAIPGDGEVEYTVAHPMDFIYCAAEQNGSGQSWFNSAFSDYAELWNYSSEAKSIYDPCPVGYRVPNSADAVYSGIDKDQMPVTSEHELQGVMFTGAGGSSYYPAAGMRDATGGFLSYLGYFGSYWSAMTYNNKQARALKFEPTGQVYVNTNVKFNAASGLSVRCVKQ